jgi:hypothetical protein
MPIDGVDREQVGEQHPAWGHGLNGHRAADESQHPLQGGATEDGALHEPHLPHALRRLGHSGGGRCTLEQLRAARHTGVVAVDHGRALAVITGVAHSSHARLPVDG